MIFPFMLILSALISPLHSLANPPAQVPLQSNPKSPQLPTPNLETAKQNAPHIFNAVHAAARQWGSSLSHNGMSFFPASIPANTHLYHGTGSNVSVTGMQWLAFEIEHAEGFARPRRGRPPPGHGRPPPGYGRPPPGYGKPPPGYGGPPPGYGGPPPGNGRPPPPPPREESWVESMEPNDGHDDDDGSDARGYLHIYKTTRELKNLLYIDGMSAGKTSIGTLDTQDLLLRASTNSSSFDDHERASDLCALGKHWGVEGFVRMEMGFELIMCAFEDGLELESARQRPVDTGLERLSTFEILRGASLRYQGIVAGRLRLDFSRMVSGYWYPLNLTNPNPERNDLPRLPIEDKEGLGRVKDDVESVVGQGWGEGTDWQGVTDMIVLRYADRLKVMAGEEAERKALETEIGILLNMFIDYKEIDIAAAVEKCAVHYLGSAAVRTNSDHLIHASFLTVTTAICSTLFRVREMLLKDKDEETSGTLAVKEAKLEMRDLIMYLNWSRWLECGKCAYSEICFVAIWPWGSTEDHFNPSCLKEEAIQARNGYWGW